MRVLLQTEHPWLEKGPTMLAMTLLIFLNLITNESPTTSGTPMAREWPDYARNDLAHHF
jgi:hypothetical protein